MTFENVPQRKDVGDAITEMATTELAAKINDAPCQDISVELPFFEVDRLCDVTRNVRQLQGLRVLTSGGNSQKCQLAMKLTM